MADVAARSAFLIEDDTVRAAWMLGKRDAGPRRGHRGGFVALALALYAACAVLATWPAVRHVEGHYLARPAPGYGEAAAGDHLQLAWAFWLPGHQLERGAAPWADPYSLPAGGDCDTEPAGLAVRDAVLAARPAVRARLGLQPHRAPLDRPRRGAHVLVATRARARARCCARRRPRLRAGAVPGRPIDRAPARADRVPAARDAARARAAALRLGGDRAHGDPAVAARSTSRWAPSCSRPATRGRGCRAPTGGRQPPAPSPRQRPRCSCSRSSWQTRSRAADAPFAQVRSLLGRALGPRHARCRTHGIEEYVFLGWLTPVLALVGLWVVRRRRGSPGVLGLAALRPVRARARVERAAVRAALAARSGHSGSRACPSG